MRFILPIEVGAEPLYYNPQTSKFISQRFGQNLINYTQFGLRGHNGWDFAAPQGTPYKAVSSGYIVEQVKEDFGFGYNLCVRSVIGGKDYVVIYGHSSDFVAKENLPWNWNRKTHWVNRGEVIGYVGHTGYTSRNLALGRNGDHLHLGIYRYDTNGNKLNVNNGYGGALNPKPFFQGKSMSNTKLVQIGNEFGYWIPATTQDGLKSQAANFGEVLPEKADGTVDFSKLTPDHVL